MLTDAKVRAAKPLDREYELVDTGGCAGLRLRVKMSGAKSWVLRVRYAGRKVRHTLARFEDMSLKEARVKADEMRPLIRQGFNPAAEAAADREALRMVDLFGESDPSDRKKDKAPGWYLGTYVKTAGKLGTAKTVGVVATDRARIVKHLRTRKALMRKRVDEVTLADLQRLKSEVPAGTWKKLRDMLRVAFAHAERIGAIPAGSSPVLHTKAAQGRKVERYLTPEERGHLEAALARAEEMGPSMKKVPRGQRGGLSPHLVRALRLLALTGMRRGEAIALRWEWIEWRLGVLRLPTSKTGKKDVPLTPQALAFLRAEQKRGGATRATGFVCGNADGQPPDPSNVERAWRTVRELAKLDGQDGKPAARLHDLRHSWASDAVSAGVPLYVVGAVLGHKAPSTTARYAHLHDAAIRSGLAVAGAAIDEATRVGVKKAQENVVKMPARKRAKATGRRAGRAPRA